MQKTELSTPSGRLRVAEVVSALSQALDLGSGSSQWHSVRACILGMRIAAELRLPEQVQSELYYTLLLKDAGCSSNASAVFHALGSDDIAAKGAVKKVDWTRTSGESIAYALKHVASGQSFWKRSKAILRVAVQQKNNNHRVTALRCERGATLARLMGLSEGTAGGIAGLDEHWDGGGNPEKLSRHEIPLSSRIALLAQTLDVFFTSEGPDAAVSRAKERSRRWFDPDLVKAVCSLSARGGLWAGLGEQRDAQIGLDMEPQQKMLEQGNITLDAICQAFAQIVDAKSPFTQNHSQGVANAAVVIARNLGFPKDGILFIRHAALLHDLGKMAISNTILEKPGKLDQDEWAAMRSHPELTLKILRCITGFEHMSEVAASHHEKLDGSGYFRGLKAEQLPMESRILVVADIFDALTADRPYRAGMPLEKVYGILRSDAPRALDPDCVEALEVSGMGCDQRFRDIYALEDQLARWNADSRLSSVSDASVCPAPIESR